ncbi:MAG: efflux RND transporter periplasmic adaptor subunit [Chitinophaga sp.]|uniref:efflux RND transporter periplasmic adaptor subunit n=1 Tax=Chitinophaga sp. TaxID=1869181 RepID=UPI001B1F1251|nr:efflux RND transporter periplasmic adaptor subunit [Chitinophaga sp.]MBO9728501.1 efflux RND transporter periplasmic adaptor subunit [Chitinophaga sp.]
MKKKVIFIVVSAGIICLIAFRLFSNKKKINESSRAAREEGFSIPVSTAVVTAEQLSVSLIKTGLIIPFREAKALSMSSGNVTSLRFKLGDHVSRGQLLALIDTHILELDLRKKESLAIKLKRDLQTYTDLLEAKAATQEKVNELRQNYSDAENQVQQVRKQIADAGVRAPTSGIISARLVEEGMYVGVGGEIASIVDLSSIKIQVDLTESEVYQVALGYKVKLTTAVYPGQSFRGVVSYISPQANQAYNYMVEITADNNEHHVLRSGTFVTADFSRETTRMVMLTPREALNETTPDASVYLAKNGRAILQRIRTGGESNGKVYVLEGLTAGDSVITSGQINLRDGARINISK